MDTGKLRIIFSILGKNIFRNEVVMSAFLPFMVVGILLP